MATLNEVVKKTVFEYAGGGFDLKMIPYANEEQQSYTVIIVDTPIHQYPAAIVVSARVVNETVVIDEDTTDKPLVDALVQNGIPRDKIILAYAGEPITVEMGIS